MGYRKLPPIRVPESPAELGYLAGLIDGEGHINITSAFDRAKSVNPSHAIHVTITNTNLALMGWLTEKVGGSVYAKPRPAEHRNWKDAYNWTVHAKNAEALLRAVMPYLIIKKDQATCALWLRELGKATNRKGGLDPELVEKREELQQLMNELNRRGMVG